MDWLIILCVILLITVVALSIKIFLMRKAADEIRNEFSNKLNNDTNTLISISSRDKGMRLLASDINVQLRELRKERHRFTQGDIELKNAITNISHDLRTPLTAICGYLDLIDDTDKSDTVNRYIKIIKGRTEIIKQLTQELFCYSVVTSYNYDTSVENILINGILEESIAGIYTTLQEKKITPNIHITEKKIVGNLNPASLSRILSNILNNAIKYSDGDLDIELTDKGELIFTNTASELSEVQVAKLFDRFYTVEASRKSTGLGLAIARTLTEQMNGTIWAKYEKGRLSIYIIFPDLNV